MERNSGLSSSETGKTDVKQVINLSFDFELFIELHSGQTLIQKFQRLGLLCRLECSDQSRNQISQRSPDPSS
jgi:hypothetical protein